ncbi:MAG: hypothetical protein Q7R76_02890 [Candidatus Woesearchaeota archaeon]|nr:hypothetical protein [Candidatus Woesearchaeota archaeon]
MRPELETKTLVNRLKDTDIGKAGVSRPECQRMIADVVREYVETAYAVTSTVIARALEELRNNADYRAEGRTPFWTRSATDWDLSRFTSAQRNPYLTVVPHKKIGDAARYFIQKKNPGISVDISWSKDHASAFAQQLIYYRDDTALELYINKHFRPKRIIYQFRES